MESKNAFILGKNPQIYVNHYRDARYNPFGTRKPNDSYPCSSRFDNDTQTRIDYFRNSNSIIQTDNRQATRVTEPTRPKRSESVETRQTPAKRYEEIKTARQ